MRTHLAFAATALSLALVPGVDADRLSPGGIIIWPPLGPSTNYVLSASYTEGCFDPCLCAIIHIDEDVTGSFSLTPLTTKLGDPVVNYAVTNVMINIGQGPASQLVTGVGSYQIMSGITVTHRMQLDLTTGPEGEFEHYDSGWIIGGFEFPDIDIAVSINGMVCFDTVFGIEATPADPADLNLDGHVNGLDLAQLLALWGQCPICIIGPCPCAGDLNGDSQVNGMDLAQLLAAWTG